MDVLVSRNPVLIIEDNLDIQASIAAVLAELGFETRFETSGRVGLHTALTNDFSLVVLDLGLPELGGMEVCRVLRQNKPALPILILTAEQEEVRKILGLELGADEFMTKPFSSDVLRARIRSLLRRMQAIDLYAEQQRGEQEQQKVVHTSGQLQVDVNERKVTIAAEELILTPIEFDLISLLMQHLGRFLSREQIIDAIWVGGGSGYEESVRTHLYRLRTKLEQVGGVIPVIENRRGVGYRMVLNPEE